MPQKARRWTLRVALVLLVLTAIFFNRLPDLQWLIEAGALFAGAAILVLFWGELNCRLGDVEVNNYSEGDREAPQGRKMLRAEHRPTSSKELKQGDFWNRERLIQILEKQQRMTERIAKGMERMERLSAFSSLPEKKEVRQREFSEFLERETEKSKAKLKH